MSKTYQTAAIATKIAARLTKSKGAEHIAIEQAPGKWVVMTKEAVDDLVNDVGAQIHAQEMQELTSAPAYEGSEHQLATQEVQTEIAPEPEPVKVEVAGNITVTLPAGSYEKGGYVYTPAIDGKARWFKTDKLLGMALEDGRVKITVTQKVLKSRGLTPEMLETQAA